MFTEDQLLKLLRVQSNIGPNEFEKLFGSQGRSLFNIFARENWNLVSFLFNKINGDNRRKLLDYVNTEIEKQ